MIGHLTLYKLYKVDLFKDSNKISAQLVYTEIDFSHVMTAGTSKLATEIFT